MGPYVLLHIPANFFADLDVFSYWASQKGIKSLHVLSHSCREGTRAQVSPRGTGWAPGLEALTQVHCTPGPHLPPAPHSTFPPALIDQTQEAQPDARS